MTRWNLIVLASLFVAAATARADPVYTHRGFPFDTDRGTAFDDAGPPTPLGAHLSLSLALVEPRSPGLDQPDGSLIHSPASTGARRGIVDRDFEDVWDSIHTHSTSTDAGDDIHISGSDFAGHTDTARLGAWTSPPTIPEPPPFSLLILSCTFLLAKHPSLRR